MDFIGCTALVKITCPSFGRIKVLISWKQFYELNLHYHHFILNYKSKVEFLLARFKSSYHFLASVLRRHMTWGFQDLVTKFLSTHH